ncbi:MAG: hypothetical protein KatS3mg077_0868 [Candidatus Binatia bacterium]|nr:MAG: hypothetical protein KatS3mg077_0868 [Candidatus Binatia bacterium]
MLHYLILIPYYFFGALSLTAFLIVSCRLFALRVPIAYLVGASVIGTVAGLLIALATYHISIDHFGFLPLLALAASSFLFAAIDAALQTWRRLPLDAELEAL